MSPGYIISLGWPTGERTSLMSEIPEELKLHIAALLDEAEYALLLLAAIFAMFVDRIFGLTATCYAN